MTTPSPCSCIICKKVTSNLGIAAHFSQAHSNAEPVGRLAMNAARRGKKSWNSGGSLSQEHRNKIKASSARTPRPETVKRLISETAKANGRSGGFREGGGKGKKGKYKGIHCDSSWELAFLITMIDAGKEVQRAQIPRRYEFEGKKKLYYPDFIIEGYTFEIKGWKTPQWEAKHEQNKDVIVLGFDDIKPMIEYAKTKFGEEFISAYDK